jgi:hypothetical protein
LLLIAAVLRAPARHAERVAEDEGKRKEAAEKCQQDMDEGVVYATTTS